MTMTCIKDRESFLNLLILKFEGMNALQSFKLHKLVPKGLSSIFNKGLKLLLYTKKMHQMTKHIES